MSIKAYTLVLFIANAHAAALLPRSGDPGFCNVVFNHVAVSNTGWPKNWNTINDHGVTNWGMYLLIEELYFLF